MGQRLILSVCVSASSRLGRSLVCKKTLQILTRRLTYHEYIAETMMLLYLKLKLNVCKRVNVNIHTAKPGMVIGGGSD